MNKFLPFLTNSIASPFRHFQVFLITIAGPLLFSLFYFQTGTDWTVDFRPDSWLGYKPIEEDLVRYLCQGVFLYFWYGYLVRRNMDNPPGYIGSAIPVFMLAYGLIFLLTKAIYWLATLFQISLFFIARGINHGLPEDANFIMIVGGTMTIVSILTITIINRCSFGLPTCSIGQYQSISDGWQKSEAQVTPLFICTLALFLLDTLLGQLASYLSDGHIVELAPEIAEWLPEITAHMKRYLLLAMTAALICKLHPQSSNRTIPLSV